VLKSVVCTHLANEDNVFSNPELKISGNIFLIFEYLQFYPQLLASLNNTVKGLKTDF
jgi:hypothetical protein